MKKAISVLLALILITCGCVAENAMPEPPTKPDGEMPGGQPPAMPDGEMPNGQPPAMPDGEMPSGMPGGNSAPESYAAVESLTEDAQISEETITSSGKDENALHVSSGEVTVTGSTISRVSDESTGGDAASFYGVGAALLTTGGALSVENSEITTDADGGAGVFAYGEGTAYVRDSSIVTAGNTSGGIHVAGGGTLYASNLTVVTSGESSAAIRSDRGSGVMVVEGGSYTSYGVGSPAVYVTADITVEDAELMATGSEALCLEGRNSVRLKNCNLTGNMADLEQNDNTWTVILYQSMSGDSQIGKGRFEMDGGTLVSGNGGIFYTTNTQSEFVLKNVEVQAGEDSEYFLRCTGNSNQRGWGRSGENGADCKFTAIKQSMSGDVLWDSISSLDLYLTAESKLCGAVIKDESCAGEGGSGGCDLYIDEESAWVVTADSALTSIHCAGSVIDAQGRIVSIVGTDGELYVDGDSEYTVTVAAYEIDCDLEGAGAIEE